MTYQQIGDAKQSQEFSRRVNGCVIDLSAAILASVTDSTSIIDDAANKLTTVACKNWCTNYIKGATVATGDVIASYLLLNSTIAANPHGCADGDMNWQLKHVFLQLVAIG